MYCRHRQMMTVMLSRMLRIGVYSRFAVGLLVALTQLAVSTAFAQEEQKTTSGPQISVGEVTGSPGASLMVPVYFTPDSKAPIKKLAATVEYVSNNMEFQEVSSAVTEQEVEVSGVFAKGTAD